jgi:ligand-binding sensor domain-containing protein
MRARDLSILFVLSTLLIAACNQGTPTPAPVPTGPGASIPQPSPSALIPTTERPDPGPLPATIDSTTTVASDVAPGWVHYESINEILDLAFAPDGGLWVATRGGLVRWDLDSGTYRRYALLAYQVAPAPDGTLWLNTESGLHRLDGTTCEQPPDVPGGTGGQIYALAVMPDGDLWTSSDLGASRFDGTSWASYPLGVGVRGLEVSDEGALWASTANGVAQYREAEDSWVFHAQEQGLPGPQVHIIGAGPGGEGWAYIAWEGLYRYNGEAWQLIESPPGGDVRDIAFAADGTPWIGTVGGSHYPGGALSYWNGEGWMDVSSATGLISFSAVAPGPDGVVAAATNLGLGIYENGEWRMLKDGPTSSREASVAVTPDGAAWFAFGDESLSTNGSGLSQLDGQEWQYHLGDAEVGAPAVAPDGSLWVGAGCSIQRFDGAAWETLAQCDQELPVGNILDIEFAADGSVWVASGLNLIQYDGQTWTRHDKLVHAVVAAPDGSVWVNGWDGSLGSQYVARFDGSEWTIYSTSETFPGRFAVSAVTPDGRVWGIVPERGLVAFDGLAAPNGQTWTDSASWEFYAPPEGFPLNGGPGPVLAPDGALWVRSQQGVARFDPAVAAAEIEGDSPDAAWTVYEHDLEGRGLGGIAFGPGGEIWFGATRFQAALAESSPAAP